MKIGLLFAMPSELRALPGIREMRPAETVSGTPFYEIAPHIIACAGGIGKVNAAMAAQTLCLKFGADLILNAGVAGCTSPLPAGTVAVVTDCVQYDMDLTAVGAAAGFVPTVERVEFPTWEPDFCAKTLEAAGFPAVMGRVATADRFVTDTPDAVRLQNTFAPLLVDMEACAIAQVCLRNGVKFVSIKTVSDCVFGGGLTDASLAFALERLGRTVPPLAEALRDMA